MARVTVWVKSPPLPYEILLVDDHPLVRQGIKTIIAEKSELAVVGELQDGLELLIA